MTDVLLLVPENQEYKQRAVTDLRRKREKNVFHSPQKIVAYTDYGITDDMRKHMLIHHNMGKDVEYRKIGKNPDHPISIVVFKWNKKGYRTEFTGEHVNRFFKQIDKHVSVPHRKICITDDQSGIDKDIETVHLWPNPCPRYGSTNPDKPNCFYRLKMFSKEIEEVVGKRFVWMDLDAVIVDNIDNILMDSADFKMWRVDDEYMPCNGSLVLHTVGTRQNIWREFSPNRVHPVTGLRAHGMIGSDQAYIATKMTDKERENTFGMKDGIYSYRCHIQKNNLIDLPKGARIVFFHGRSNPWDQGMAEKYPWIRKAYEL